MTEPVDLALLLAFDGSASVTFEEFGLIAGGCGAALRDPSVVAGLIGGPSHGTLCAVLLWSGHAAQDVLVDWVRLGSAQDVATLAATMEALPRTIPPGTTAIGSGLLRCETMLAALPAPARRRVIDMAGDGRSNDGPPPGPIRDRLVAAGVTINGLCVLHEEPDLVRTYQQEVVGGPGGFALACPDYATFAAAMQQKLAQELAWGGPHAGSPS